MFKENMKKIIRADHLILLVILIIAAVFRFYKLRTAPDWYVDEGEFIRLADYLSKGNLNFLGIRNSMLLIGRPPLFLLILAGAFKIFGTDIIVLRNLTVICSILSIGICYYLTRQALGRTPAFYAAFLLAIFPKYIFYNRIGFSYNWTSLWMLIFVFVLWKYLTLDNQRWLLVACLAAGIAYASDYIGIICVLVLLLGIMLTHPKQLWKMVIVGIPWLISMSPIFIIAPVDTWHDLTFTIFWASGGEGDLILKLAGMFGKYAQMIDSQTLIVLGIIGIFTISNKRLLGIILLMMSGVFVLILVPGRILMAQYLLPAWPLLMIGLGNFLEKTVAYFFLNLKSSLIDLKLIQKWIVSETLRNFLGSIGLTLLVFLVVYLPITWMIILDVRGFVMEPVDPYIALTELPNAVGFIPANDAEAIAKEISRKLNPGDFAIAPGQIYWMLSCNATDIRQVVVYEFGGETLGNPGINKDRFIVNSSLSNARYVVVDNTWRVLWADSVPEIASMLEEVRTWPMLMSKGDVQLFCNPQYCQ